MQYLNICQIIETQKCAKALQVFLGGIDKIEPNYQQAASAEFCSILLDYSRKHS